jgi:serine/threonine-protein phosphatase CPPED1
VTTTSRFVFLADTQLGAYATFSGLSEDEAAAFLPRGMRVSSVPKVDGHEWDAVRYRAAVDAVNALRPDFVVIGGDMIDNASSQDQLDELLEISSLLDPSIPLHWVPGNHDIAPDSVAPTAESIARYLKVFGPDFYSFGANGTRFVVMNTVVLDEPRHVPDHLEQQFAFLEDEMKGARDADHIVLFGHHPLFVDYADEPDSYWNIPRQRRMRLLRLIHEYRVEIAFAGHLHRNAEARDGGFTMVTSGPVGYPLGNDASGLRVVDIGPDRITHEYRPLQLPDEPTEEDSV